MSSAAAVAEEWVEALNRRDLGRLMELATEDFELVTMRRGTTGRDGLAGWVHRQAYGVALTIHAERWFESGGTAALGGRGEWRYVEDGRVAEEGPTASSFSVVGGQVRRMTIHPHLPAALVAAGLGEGDELRR